MSKLLFRARAVDVNKRMPVFSSDEIPDLAEYVSTNRAMPQLPTGMEKEEEMEHHLQKAITARQRISTGEAVDASDSAVIPIPRVTTDIDHYERLYPPNYKLPKQLIRVQAALNPDAPNYDLDSEDESWLRSSEVPELQFERIMEALETQIESKMIQSSDIGTLLPGEDEGLVLVVYDYWLAKKCATQGRQLIPRVKTEKRDGTQANNPYVAFRRRAEKMQTRKNRRNDEESYEKILKLRADLEKAVLLSELVKKREESKRQLISANLEIMEKRFRMGDFQTILPGLASGSAQGSVCRRVEKTRVFPNIEVKKKMINKKLSQLLVPRASSHIISCVAEAMKPAATSSPTAASLPVEDGDEESNDGWSEYRPVCLHSRRSDSTSFVGPLRRRVGRGGRALLDRAPRPWRESSALPSTSCANNQKAAYRPVSMEDMETDAVTSTLQEEPMVMVMGPEGSLTLSATVGVSTAEEDDRLGCEDGGGKSDTMMELSSPVIELSSDQSLLVSQSLLTSPPQRSWKTALDDSGATIEVDLDSSTDLLPASDSSLAATMPLTPSPPAPPPYHHHHHHTRPATSPSSLPRPIALSLNQLNVSESTPPRKNSASAVQPKLNWILSNLQPVGARTVASPGQAFVLPSGLFRIGPKALISAPNRARARSVLRMGTNRQLKTSRVLTMGSRSVRSSVVSPVITPACDHGNYFASDYNGSPRNYRYAPDSSQTDQYNGDQLVGKSATTELIQLGYPLPTPSPSPGAADTGESATKWEDYLSKARPMPTQVLLTRPTLGETHGTGIK